ncbi:MULTISPECIES: hypothetical protein [unclassified Streptomyces]|uniref:hypothetical protein n=1 Tax=unclassified Streptomyces TaxID=2593676 RepID=UPI0035D56123
MTAVPFDIDPVRTPLMVGRRPANHWFPPLPPGVFQSDARPVLARDVRPGDLIVAAFTEFTASRVTRGTQWIRAPYAADPSPWDPGCACPECSNVRTFLGPVPDAGRVSMTCEDGVCDVWDNDDAVLIIPAALLLIPVPA